MDEPVRIGSAVIPAVLVLDTSSISGRGRLPHRRRLPAAVDSIFMFAFAALWGMPLTNRPAKTARAG